MGAQAWFWACQLGSAHNSVSSFGDTMEVRPQAFMLDSMDVHEDFNDQTALKEHSQGNGLDWDESGPSSLSEMAFGMELDEHWPVLPESQEPCRIAHSSAGIAEMKAVSTPQPLDSSLFGRECPLNRCESSPTSAGLSEEAHAWCTQERGCLYLRDPFRQQDAIRDHIARFQSECASLVRTNAGCTPY